MKRAMSYDEFLNEQEKFSLVDINEFVEAASIDNIETMKYYVDKGLDPNSISTNKTRALHMAAYCGKLNALKFLLSLPNIEINSLDSSKRTALHLAVNGNKPEAVKMLLIAGIDYEHTHDRGKTALEDSSRSMDKRCFDILSNPNVYLLQAKLEPTMNKVQKNSGIF